MDNFYSAMMSGTQPEQDDDEALGELPEELRQSQSGQAGGPAADLLGELLQGLLSGGDTGIQAAPEGQMPMGGGLMGSQPGQPGGAGADLLGELLQGLLSGGGAGVQAAPGAQMPMGGGLPGILGALLGGGGAGQIGGTPNLMPFTQALSEKLGISPQLASALIGVAFTLLTGMLQKSSQPGRSGAAGMDLDTMLDEEFLASSGMAGQVAEQTGLDEETAAHHLREAMVMLTSEYPGEVSAGP